MKREILKTIIGIGIAFFFIFLLEYNIKYGISDISIGNITALLPNIVRTLLIVFAIFLFIILLGSKKNKS